MALQGEVARVHRSVPITRLLRHQRVIARLVWLAVVLLAFTVLAISLASTYQDLRNPPADVKAGLNELGLAEIAYALVLTAVAAIFAGGCFVISYLIVRKRRDDGMALFTAFCLILLGGASNPTLQSLVNQHPSLEPLAIVLSFLLWISLAALALLFPDGRSVPGKTIYGLVVWAATLGLLLVFTGESLLEPSGAIGVLIFVALLSGAGSQIFRYVRVSGPLQRQQTKWVAFALALALVTQITYVMVAPDSLALGRPGSRYDLGGVTVITFGYLLIPIALGIAILRNHLWNIDIVLNRAMVYGALTASVVALYALIVGGLGSLVQTAGNTVLSLVAAGLIAITFQPLRLRLQRSVNRLMYGERDEPYAVLSRLSRRLEGTVAPEAALVTIVETVRDALKLPYVAISVYGDGESRLAVAAGDVVADPVRLPLTYHQELVGELLLAARGPGETFSGADQRLLDDLARQTGIAVHAVQLTAELQRSRERLVTAREEERRRLRRDLHDGLGPAIAAQTLKAGSARAMLGTDPNAAAALLLSLENDQEALLVEVRRLVYDLRPPALDELGLIGAIRQRAIELSRSGSSTEAIRIEVDAPTTLPPLPAAVEVAAYRIVHEALTNVIHHARATSCDVMLVVERDQLRVEVRDNGLGLAAARRAGVGSASMRERAAELGGSCTIESGEVGTTVAALLPLPGHD